eukprot:6198433-Karenia_brevis.AAC.1
MQNGRTISLGTVGKERDWRNKQRHARNRGRSRADIPTVNLLTLLRFVREVAARAAAGRRREQKLTCSRPDQMHDEVLASGEIALVLLDGQASGAPLARAAGSGIATPRAAEEVGYVYSLFREGSL